MSEDPARRLAELVRSHRILVCAGSGGVGKTTTAASLALWGAMQGRHAIVLTIDPARRLADSLGVGPFGNTPVRVSPETFERAGIAVRPLVVDLILLFVRVWMRHLRYGYRLGK